MKKYLWLTLVLGILINASGMALAGAIRSGFNQNALPANDDGATSLVNIGFTVNFFGHKYSQLYVNNNGNVTFDAPQATYTPYSLSSTQRVIIAPFFGDVDTRGPNSDIVRYGYGTGMVDGHPAFGVNWINVGYYAAHSDRLNSFQLVIIDRSDLGPGRFVFEFNYDKIQWETGDASGGSGGLGGYSARAGFSNGTGDPGTFYELTGSGSHGAFLDSGSNALVSHRLNSNTSGRYVFSVLSDDPKVTPPWDTSHPVHGDPVDLSSGEESHAPAPDIVVKNFTGPSVSFSRTFVSVHAKAGECSPGLTPGWMHNYDQSLTPLIPGTWNALLFHNANGAIEKFTPMLDANGNPTGDFTLKPGTPYQVTGVPGINGDWQSVTVKSRDQSVIYTAITTDHYRPWQLADALNHRIQFQWNTDETLDTITDVTTGRTLLICTYNAGLLNSISDGSRSIHYSYGTVDVGSLVTCLQEVSQVVAPSVASPFPWRWRYEYTGYNSQPLLSVIKQPSPANPSTETTLSFTYNNDGKVTTQIDSIGNRSIYTFNSDNTVVTIKKPLPSDEIVQQYTQRYDALGRDIGITDCNGKQTHIEYGDVNNPTLPTKVIAKDGRYTTYAYDQWGNVTLTTDTQGITTTTGYIYPATYPFGRPSEVKRGTVVLARMTYLEPSGLVKTITTPRPGTTGTDTVTVTSTYDIEITPGQPYGKVVSVEGPGNDAVTTHVETVICNYTTDNNYDANGNSGTFTTASNGLPLTITDKKGRTTHQRYDARGNTTVIIDPDGRRTDIEYDLADQPVKFISPTDPINGKRRTLVTEYLYPGGLPKKVTTYDDVSLASVVHTVETQYDSEGRVVDSWINGQHVTGMAYDALGRKVEFTDYQGSPTGRTTHYAYDLVGRLTTITDPSGETSTNTAWDEEGRVLQSTNRRGMTTSYTYNGPGGLLSTTDYDTTPALTPDISYDYNGDGRVASVTDSSGARSFMYDVTGLMTKVSTSYAASGGPSVLDISYTYNPDGSLRQMNTPAGAYCYHYNADGQLISLTNPAGKTARWTYRSDGLIQRQTLGNRAWTTYEYDQMARLSRQANYSPKGRILADYTVGGRDANTDDITMLSSVLPGTQAFSGIQQFAYNANAQLTQEQWVSRNQIPVTVAYTFDDAGNILTSPHDGLLGYAGKTRAYDANNRWVGFIDPATGLPTLGTDKFAYDEAGNPTIYKGDGLVFDESNKMTEYRSGGLSGVLVMQAGYRSDGLRAWKETAAGRSYFIYHGTTLVAEVNSVGAVKAYMTWGPTGLLARTSSSANGERWYLFDLTGNVALRLDATGQVKSTDRYDAYGTLQAGGDNDDPYGYKAQAGYYTDHATGLILCTWRYYDPLAGRWLTEDPIGYDGGINLYQYCKNSPVSNRDSSGLYFGVDDLVFSIGGAIVGAAGQLISDVVNGGEISSWQTYTGAIVGGAVSGEVLLYAGPVAAGAAGGLVSNGVTQGLNMATGVQQSFDWGSMTQSVVIGGLTGLIGGSTIPGVTAGRNSLNAIFKQISTKAINGTISRVSMQTAIKMFIGRAVDKALLEGMIAPSMVSNVWDLFNSGTMDLMNQLDPSIWCN